MSPAESELAKTSKAAKGRPAQERTNLRMIEDLRELITALERRVPRLERTGEIEIARDAAALKAKALDRIAELEKPTE